MPSDDFAGLYGALLTILLRVTIQSVEPAQTMVLKICFQTNKISNVSKQLSDMTLNIDGVFSV
jgi:hypothetical protein